MEAKRLSSRMRNGPWVCSIDSLPSSFPQEWPDVYRVPTGPGIRQYAYDISDT